jgi:hypothetical protein
LIWLNTDNYSDVTMQSGAPCAERGANMARIIQFPKRPRIQARLASPPPPHIEHQAWRVLRENPIVQILGFLVVAIIVLTWPILRWLIAADLVIQLVRWIFIGGLAGFVAVIHFLIVGIVAYLILRSAGTTRR